MGRVVGEEASTPRIFIIQKYPIPYPNLLIAYVQGSPFKERITFQSFLLAFYDAKGGDSRSSLLTFIFLIFNFLIFYFILGNTLTILFGCER